ncbi:MAG: hypothetical protein ABI867_00470 [Kofleriaceae bacterium]
MAAPFCPSCGGVTVWHAELNQWGCDRCRQMLPAAPPQSFQPAVTPIHQLGHVAIPPPPPAPPPTPGCQRCGMSATFYPQNNSWGCQRCQLPVIPIKFIAPPTFSAGRFLLITFVVIAIIAINLVVGLVM